MKLPKGFRPMTPKQWKYYLYVVRWCIQRDFPDKAILQQTQLSPEELQDFKKEVMDAFGDERGTKGSYRHLNQL